MTPGRRCCLVLLGLLGGALGAAAAGEAQVIYPGGAPAATAAAARPPDAGLGAVTVVGSVALAAVGGWLLWRGRQLPFPGRTARKLAIEETRSLGSRQYLVVASYEGQKLLLGVCPGRIDLLTPLAGPPARTPAP